MEIKVCSVSVADQEKALKFYTEVLGFVKKADISMGAYRWLTVISPEGSAEIELLLEPMAFPPAQVYQQALYNAGIPATGFQSADIYAEYERLKTAGVIFKKEPSNAGPATMAMFDHTCGNWIQLYQVGV